MKEKCIKCGGTGIDKKYKIVYKMQKEYLNKKEEDIEYIRCSSCHGFKKVGWTDNIIYKNFKTTIYLDLAYKTAEWILYNKPQKDGEDWISFPYITKESIKKFYKFIDDILKDYRDELIEDRVTDQNFIDYLIDIYGEGKNLLEFIENNVNINWDDVIEDMIETDGLGHFLSSYDGELHYLDGKYVGWRES